LCCQVALATNESGCTVTFANCNLVDDGDVYVAFANDKPLEVLKKCNSGNAAFAINLFAERFKKV